MFCLLILDCFITFIIIIYVITIFCRCKVITSRNIHKRSHASLFIISIFQPLCFPSVYHCFFLIMFHPFPGVPEVPVVTSSPHGDETRSYNLTWTTYTYCPLTRFIIKYRTTEPEEVFWRVSVIIFRSIGFLPDRTIGYTDQQRVFLSRNIGTGFISQVVCSSDHVFPFEV